MKNIVHLRHYSLLIGTIMCGMGIVIFLNFSIQDFLTPGFVQKGIILESFEMQGGATTSGIIHVNEIGKQYVIILSDNDAPTKWDVRIEGIEGEIVHNTIFEKGEIRFTPDVKGDYSIYVKNQSGKPSSISLMYGLPQEHTQTSLIMTALGVLLIMGGNYLIFHKLVRSISNWFLDN